ncbi:YhcN/YlaJ family sporulation lipoprotein [Paenibacillus puldeungensis]|uniref:YhcN/YlaJ family sporulation lipoprotein n=1 Tax=Paenibacillus puldeungensis TaxID=696536 RepID=A0ABW3S291_9BACL
MRGLKVLNLSLSAALLVGTVGIAGCGYNRDNKVRTQNVRNNTARTYDVNSLTDGHRMFTRSAGHGHDERIRSLRYSRALSNTVAQMRDVKTADVVLTDRDAYVAVTLNGNFTGRTTNFGTMQTPTSFGRGTTNVAGPYGADYGTRGVGDDGLGRGLLGRTGMNATENAALDSGYTRGLGTGMSSRSGSMYPSNMGPNVTRGIGTTGTGTTGTGTNADMLTTDNYNSYSYNNYSAYKPTITDYVPQHLKDSIEATVKKSAPHIRNVYVSGDREFVSRMGTYTMGTRNGGTLHNVIDEFQLMIQRVFPGRTGTMTGPNGYTPTSPNTGAGMRTGGTGGGFTGGTSR